MFEKSQFRLTLFFAGILALVIGVLIYLFHYSLEEWLLSEQEFALVAFAEEEALEHSIFVNHGYSITPEEQSEMVQSSNIRNKFFYVVDTKGELINQARVRGEIESSVLEAIRTWQTPPKKILILKVAKKKIMMTSLPIEINSEIKGVVYVGGDLAPAIKEMERWTWWLALLGVGALICSIFLSYLMASKVMIPIKEAYEKQKEFSADASHELRTPLSVMLSSIEVLEKTGKDRTEFEGTILKGLKDEVYHMNHLIADLLLLARADNPYYRQIYKIRFNLSPTIENVVRRLTPLAKEKEIDLQWVRQNVMFYGDQGKLEEVLTILVDNAIKYNQSGGWVKIGLCEKGKEVYLTISDDGKGLAKKDQNKIFDRFYRVEPSRVQEPEGTGLGLAIAYELIKLHEGKIKIESEVGKGSTFTVILPKV